ncbi:MAG: hypothetical protein GY866_26590 [Proteobacteria bacterium]|nr:hypothetical protein [Pseudomonadota bacterium]
MNKTRYQGDMAPDVEKEAENIRLIHESVDQVPVQEIVAEVQKVAGLFLHKSARQFPLFVEYIENFSRLMEIIDLIAKNAMVLAGEMRKIRDRVAPDNRLIRECLDVITDRIFELNLLNADLVVYDRNLRRLLRRKTQFQNKTSSAKPYARVIREERDLMHTLQLFGLTVTKGLKSLKTGIHPSSLLKRKDDPEDIKRLLENSKYNYTRVTHAVIRYFQAVSRFLVPNVRVVVRGGKEVLFRLEGGTTRDDTYLFILDTIAACSKKQADMLRKTCTDPLLDEFRVSHDNLRVIGFGKLVIPTYQAYENRMIGGPEKKGRRREPTLKEELKNIQKLKIQMHQLNRITRLGRMGPSLEQTKRKIFLQNFILSVEFTDLIKKLCRHLIEPINYDRVIDMLYDEKMKVHLQETAGTLKSLGDVSQQTRTEVFSEIKFLSMFHPNARLFQAPADNLPAGPEPQAEDADPGSNAPAYEHQLDGRTYVNTTPSKIEAFLVVYGFFFYKAVTGTENF